MGGNHLLMPGIVLFAIHELFQVIRFYSFIPLFIFYYGFYL